MSNIIFFDIKTSTIEPSYESLDDLGKQLITDKFNKSDYISDSIESYYSNVIPIYPEFSKIICISYGFKVNEKYTIKSFVGNERDIIENFFNLIEKNKQNLILSGFNIISFDIGFLLIRSLVNKIGLHHLLNLNNVAPWKYNEYIIDIQKYCKGPGFTNKTLSEISYALGFGVNDKCIDSKDTSKLYWEGNLTECTRCCEQSVKYVIKIFERIYNNK